MEITSPITKEQLVDALHSRGYVGVNIRQVIEWRSRGLLPSFDVQGKGRGRSQGREESKWSNADLVVKQSAWIVELLNLYGTYDQIYIPLWLLGYDVPYKRIRQTLSQPLARTVSGVQKECNSECNAEDVLSDAAHRLAARLRREESPILHVPADAIELILNVFLNPTYDMTDEGVFVAWQLWQEHCAQLQRSSSTGNGTLHPSTVDSLDTLMHHAAIAQQYLSVSEIKRAVDESSDDDLRTIERDVEILRRIASKFARLLRRELPADVRLPHELVWRFVFGLGRIAICADLSVRRHGFGPDIDVLLIDVDQKVEIAFNKKFENHRSAQYAHTT